MVDFKYICKESQHMHWWQSSLNVFLVFLVIGVEKISASNEHTCRPSMIYPLENLPRLKPPTKVDAANIDESNNWKKCIQIWISAYRADRPTIRPGWSLCLSFFLQPTEKLIIFLFEFSLPGTWKLQYTRVNILDLKILQVFFKNRGEILVF